MVQECKNATSGWRGIAKVLVWTVLGTCWILYILRNFELSTVGVILFYRAQPLVAFQ